MRNPERSASIMFPAYKIASAKSKDPGNASCTMLTQGVLSITVSL